MKETGANDKHWKCGSRHITVITVIIAVLTDNNSNNRILKGTPKLVLLYCSSIPVQAIRSLQNEEADLSNLKTEDVMEVISNFNTIFRWNFLIILMTYILIDISGHVFCQSSRVCCYGDGGTPNFIGRNRRKLINVTFPK